MIRWLALAALALSTPLNSWSKENAAKLAAICRDQGGTWVSTQHGTRGCQCPNGQYLKNIYFEVCHRAKSPGSGAAQQPHPQDSSLTTWGQKGQTWALSSQSRSFPDSQQVLNSFLQSANSRDIDGAMSLVNDYEVHPSREVDGVNELLRRFKSVGSRDQDLRQTRTFGSVAEPQAPWSGCHYLEEYAVTLVDGQDKNRAIGRMVIFCAHLSVKGQGKHPKAQAEKECPHFRPTNPQFSCKVGRVEMF